MLVYLKQNEDYCVFMQGGRYATWIKSDEFIDRIKEIDNVDKANCSNQDERALLLTKRRTDLHTLLNIIGRKVDEYDYDDVLNTSTSLDSVWTTLEQTYDIGRKGVQFLELQNIIYDKKESPVKFYKRVYHLVMDNLYKKGEVFNDTPLGDNEKLSPTLLNFI